MAYSGFPPGMFERGGPKGVGDLGALPQEKKNARGGPDPPGALPGGNPDIDDKNVFLVDNAHTKSR